MPIFQNLIISFTGIMDLGSELSLNFTEKLKIGRPPPAWSTSYFDLRLELKNDFDTGCPLNILFIIYILHTYIIYLFCSLNIFFPSNVVIFLNSASSAAALVFYLPGVCTHTDIERKQRKARVRNIKKTQYLMNTP